jgi:ABC-type branched-subunit amino acid transport system ATPase component
MALLEVENLRVSFGRSTAVDGVDLAVDDGQVVGPGPAVRSRTPPSRR